jgi:hypothetical protein
MMKKLPVDHDRAHTSLQTRLGAWSPRIGAPVRVLRRYRWLRRQWSWRQGAGLAPAARASSPVAPGVPELVFAAVRPGFVAACIVEAASAEGGQRTGPGGVGGGGRRPGQPHQHRRPVSGPRPVRTRPVSRLARTRRAGGRRVAVQGSHDAVPCELKQTNGTFYQGCEQALKEAFGAVRLSPCETPPMLRTCNWLL